MSLYEISERYKETFLALADMEDMPLEAIQDTLEGVEGEFKDKGLAVAAFFQNMEAEAAAIKEAETRMAARRKALENRIMRLKNYLLDNMEQTGINEISCAHFSIKVKKNPPAVVVDDETKIPAEFIVTITKTAVDKTAIKKAGGCEGAHIEQKNRLEIK